MVCQPPSPFPSVTNLVVEYLSIKCKMRRTVFARALSHSLFYFRMYVWGKVLSKDSLCVSHTDTLLKRILLQKVLESRVYYKLRLFAYWNVGECTTSRPLHWINLECSKVFLKSPCVFLVCTTTGFLYFRLFVSVLFLTNYNEGSLTSPHCWLLVLRV